MEGGDTFKFHKVDFRPSVDARIREYLVQIPQGRFQTIYILFKSDSGVRFKFHKVDFRLMRRHGYEDLPLMFKFHKVDFRPTGVFVPSSCRKPVQIPQGRFQTVGS